MRSDSCSDSDCSLEEEDRVLDAQRMHKDDAQWDGWDEDGSEPTQCMFCADVLPALPQALEHMSTAHAFNVVEYTRNYSFYRRIRLINFVRGMVKRGEDPFPILRNTSPEELGAKLESDDQYLIPILSDDPLLYELEEFLELEELGKDAAEQEREQQQREATVDFERQYAELLETFEAYKAFVGERFLESAPAEKSTTEQPKLLASEAEKEPSASATASKTMKEEVPSVDELDYYFRSYSFMEIHEDMLKDRVRTDAYRDFIYENKHLFKDKVVLDVGCGTGILSMFAVRAGAKKVIAVDNSNMIENARRIAKANGLEDKMDFRRCKVEHLYLGGGEESKVDIVISEWMGYFLLYEGMLDSVIHARDHWMKPNGFMCPSQASMHLAGIQDLEWLNDRYDFWKDVYGFDMSCMQEFLHDAAIVDIAGKRSLLTSVADLVTFDLNKVSVKELDFEAEFTLTATEAGEMYALCGWFDIEFHGNSGDNEQSYQPIRFSTAPTATPTHWKQVILLFRDGPIQVQAGTEVKGVLNCRKSTENPRELVLDVQCATVSESGQPKQERKQTFFVR